MLCSFAPNCWLQIVFPNQPGVGFTWGGLKLGKKQRASVRGQVTALKLRITRFNWKWAFNFVSNQFKWFWWGQKLQKLVSVWWQKAAYVWTALACQTQSYFQPFLEATLERIGRKLFDIIFDGTGRHHSHHHHHHHESSFDCSSKC